MGGDSGPVYTRATNGGITHNASTNNAGSHSHTINVSSVGDNLSHNNMQPYMPVYMWRRTAQRAVGELPAHTHTASTNTAGDHSHTFTFGRSYESDRGVPGGGDGDRTYTNSTNTAGSHIHTIAISNTGNNKTHNNMQPYIGVYLWQRTAQYAVGELASHGHNITMSSAGNHNHGIYSHYNEEGSNGVADAYRSTANGVYTENAGDHTHIANIENTGSGTPHNNMQPYIAVFMWLRTA